MPSAISISSPACSALVAASRSSRAKPCVVRSTTDPASLTTKPLKPELTAQHVADQATVGGARHTADADVRGHDVAGPRLDRGGERRQVDVAQLALGDVYLVVVAPAQRGAVTDVVLRPRDDTIGGADGRALEAAHLRRGHRSAQVGILPGALDDAAPARIAGDVDHRRERPVDAHCPCLTSGDRLDLFDDLRIP